MNEGMALPKGLKPGYQKSGPHKSKFVVRGTDGNFGMPLGWVALTVHSESACALPDQCSVHHPSDHPLKGWKQYWRADKGCMERICPGCGTGHPDPDELAYVDSLDPENMSWWGVHGCAGCCSDGICRVKVADSATSADSGLRP